MTARDDYPEATGQDATERLAIYHQDIVRRQSNWIFAGEEIRPIDVDTE